MTPQGDTPLVAPIPSVLSSHNFRPITSVLSSYGLDPFGALPSDMDLCAPRNMTITISVTKGGLSNPLVYQLTKARTSIGRAGGGADIEIDDPQVSALHCAVGVTQDMVRLCDLDSANGTYLNGQRVEAVELEHLTEFCLGSTWLVVTIVPKHFSVSEHSI